MFQNILNWFHMGGYGVYIWPVYLLGVSTLFLHLQRLSAFKSVTKKNLIAWYKQDSSL